MCDLLAVLVWGIEVNKSKGFGNPQVSKELEKSVKSIKKQLLTLFANLSSKPDAIPLFSTSRKRALQIAVNQIAQERSDIYIRVFHDKELGTCAFVLACEEAVEDHDYLWLEQSKITNKNYLLMNFLEKLPSRSISYKVCSQKVYLLITVVPPYEREIQHPHLLK